MSYSHPVPLAALSPHACLWCVYARSSPGTEMHFPHQFEEIHLWVPLSLNVIIHDDDSSALVAFRVVLVDFTLSIHHSYQRRVRPYRSFIFSRRITFTEISQRVQLKCLLHTRRSLDCAYYTCSSDLFRKFAGKLRIRGQICTVHFFSKQLSISAHQRSCQSVIHNATCLNQKLRGGFNLWWCKAQYASYFCNLY